MEAEAKDEEKRPLGLEQHSSLALSSDNKLFWLNLWKPLLF